MLMKFYSHSQDSKCCYPTVQWCNISLNIFLLTFLSTSRSSHSDKQSNSLSDWDLDTYHSLTFRLPTWSVPTAVLDTDFWACHSCKLAYKYFCLASVFRIYFTVFSGYSMAYRKTKTKSVFIKCLTTSYYFIYKWEDAHENIVQVGAVFQLFSFIKMVLFHLPKQKYTAVILLWSWHSVSGQGVTFCTFYLEEFGPEKQKSNNMWFRAAAEPVTSHQLVI